MINDMGEQRERLQRGDWYLDEPELAEDRRRCWRLLDRFNATGPDDDALRTELLGELFGAVGTDSWVMPRFTCSYGTNIRLGSNSFLNWDAILMDDAPIIIGDDVSIGPRVQLLTAIHPMTDHEQRRGRWERALPITIGNNVWFGGGVIVCPGVTIGDNAVVGAGSVVTRDVPGAVFSAGNPARVVRKI